MVLLIGHRGAPGYRPEHTRSSYELAIAQGVHAIEPDVVPTRDGVLVVRHENEISSTTDIASRPELAHRRTTKRVAGARASGWFTEDMDWAELSAVRCRERIPDIRPASAEHDGREPILRLRDVLDIARDAGIGVVIEIKHAPYFQAIGLDACALLADELRAAGWQEESLAGRLVIECFEQSALTALQALGVRARYVYLIERTGTAADLAGVRGAPSYRQQLAPAGLDRLAEEVDGISVHKSLLLGATPLAASARDRGLDLYTWTVRAENRFLDRRFRIGSDPAAHGDWRAEWEILRRADLTGVFTDQPDLARRVWG